MGEEKAAMCFCGVLVEAVGVAIVVVGGGLWLVREVEGNRRGS